MVSMYFLFTWWLLKANLTMLIIVQSYDNVKIDGIEDALIELIYMIAFFL